MDLGATICTPRAPELSGLPAGRRYARRALGIQEQRPVVEKKPAIATLYRHRGGDLS